MSTPPFLALPPCASALVLPTARGPRAALVTSPERVRGTAVLVPGFTGSKEDFIAVLAPLTAAGWQVVAFDQRGQFESPGTGVEADYTAEALAADVVAVADAVDPAPVHLVGHSLGGLVARAAVLADASRWASLGLLCSGPGAIPEPQRPSLRALCELLPATPLEHVWAAMAERDAANGVPLPPQDVHAFLHRRFVANDPVALRAKATILLAEPDRVPALAAALIAVTLPAVVVTGDGDDVWLPAEQHEMARRLDVAWVTIEGAGHSPAVDRPAATAAAFDALWSGRDHP